MIHFEKSLQYNNCLLNVKFSQVIAPHAKFFIEINSVDSLMHCFEMQADHCNQWQIIPPVEEWIVDLQNQLSKIILSELN